MLGPIVVKDDFGEAAWGWALGALMAGFMVGGLVTLRWRPRRPVYAGTILLGLTACFPAALASPVGLTWVLVGAFLHGFGLEIFSVNWDVAIQQNIPPEKLARVFSFDVAGSFAARPVSYTHLDVYKRQGQHARAGAEPEHQETSIPKRVCMARR